MEIVEQETDSLRSLEERIHQAVQLVNRLRQEKEAAVQRAEQLSTEVEALRAERKQVRSRIEKLLGQVYQLSVAQTRMDPSEKNSVRVTILGQSYTLRAQG